MISPGGRGEAGSQHKQTKPSQLLNYSQALFLHRGARVDLFFSESRHHILVLPSPPPYFKSEHSTGQVGWAAAGLLQSFLMWSPAPTCAKATEVRVDMLPSNSAARFLASPMPERNGSSEKVYGNFVFLFFLSSLPCCYHSSVRVAMEKAALSNKTETREPLR